MNINRYFFKRKFSKQFSNVLHRYIFKIIFRKIDLEVPDIGTLVVGPNDKRTVTVYISGRKSRIEQFILGGYMINENIVPPTHSFGPQTVFFRKHRELWQIFLSFFKPSLLKEEHIDSIYIPLDSPEELAIDPAFTDTFRKVKFKEARIVPVITMWNKNLDRKSRWQWIENYFGKYNLWSTTRELLLLLIKRRKLTLRIGIPVSAGFDERPDIFIKKLYRLMEDSKKNVVGAALKNWLDLKNDALLNMNLEDDEARKKAIGIIDRIATKYSPAMAETYTDLTGRLLRTVFSRFHYSQEEIVLLRRICTMSNANMILIPTHKSYFDYLILNYILYNEKVTVPLVASGDNLDFFPLSSVLRKMGAFYIKRKIGDDDLYRDVLKSYMKQIISAGYNMEFFIEGGRSRSGLVRSPRIGMLKMLSEISKESSRKLYVVPVTITYEKLKEIEEYKHEGTAGKKPESDNFFTRLGNLLSINYGPVYIRFARPVYLSTKFSVETAFRIAETQEKQTVISFSSVFSTLFLTFENITSRELVERMEFICDELQKINYVRTATSLKNLDVNCSKLLSKLVKKGDIIQTSVDEREAFSLKDRAVPEFLFYKNSISFAFAPLFCLISKDLSSNDLIIEFLENVIMGFNRPMLLGLEIDTSNYPEWFNKTVKRFFFEKFSSLKNLLEILLSNDDIFTKQLSRTDFVDRIFPAVNKKIRTFTKDELFEAIFFLEKKTVLTNNLTDLNRELAESYVSGTDDVLKFIQREET